MRYWAAPMLPLSDVASGDEVGLGAGVPPPEDEHAASSAAMVTTSARLTDQ